MFDWVYRGWQDIFMAEPGLWALLPGAGELAIAMLLIFARRLGYVCVVAFHLALMLFGWGIWPWCVPALAFAVPAAVQRGVVAVHLDRVELSDTAVNGAVGGGRNGARGR